MFLELSTNNYELRMPGQNLDLIGSRPIKKRETGSGDARHLIHFAIGPDYGIQFPFGQLQKHDLPTRKSDQILITTHFLWGEGWVGVMSIQFYCLY